MLRAGSAKAVLCVTVCVDTGENLGQGVRHQLTLDDPELVPSQQLWEEVCFVFLPSHLLGPEVNDKATYYAALKAARDKRIKTHRIKLGAEVPDLSRWTAPTTMRYSKTKTKNRILRHNLRNFPGAEDRVRCCAQGCQKPAIERAWKCSRLERRCKEHVHQILRCIGRLTQCRCAAPTINSTAKQEEEAALSLGATICIETEEDGWVEGEIVLIRSFPKTKGGKRHRIG